MDFDFENFDRNDCTRLIRATKTGDLEAVKLVLAYLLHIERQQREEQQDLQPSVHDDGNKDVADHADDDSTKDVADHADDDSTKDVTDHADDDSTKDVADHADDDSIEDIADHADNDSTKDIADDASSEDVADNDADGSDDEDMADSDADDSYEDIADYYKDISYEGDDIADHHDDADTVAAAGRSVGTEEPVVPRSLIAWYPRVALSGLHTTDRQGYTALHHAALLGHKLVLDALLLHADERCVNTESHDRTTALLLLCKSQHPLEDRVSMLQMLLAAGADPNLPLEQPFSLPLPSVLETRWWSGARLLLEAGANPRGADFEHDKAPPAVLATDHPPTLELIAERGGLTTSLAEQRATARRKRRTKTDSYEFPEDGCYYKQVHLLEWMLTPVYRAIGPMAADSCNTVEHCLEVCRIILPRDLSCRIHALTCANDAIRMGHWVLAERLLSNGFMCDPPEFPDLLSALSEQRTEVEPQLFERIVRLTLRGIFTLREEVVTYENSADELDESCEIAALLDLLSSCTPEVLSILLDGKTDIPHPIGNWSDAPRHIVRHLLQESDILQPHSLTVLNMLLQSDNLVYFNKQLQHGVAIQGEDFFLMMSNSHIKVRDAVAMIRDDGSQQALYVRGLVELYEKQGNCLGHPSVYEPFAASCSPASNAGLFLLLREGLPGHLLTDALLKALNGCEPQKLPAMYKRLKMVRQFVHNFPERLLAWSPTADKDMNYQALLEDNACPPALQRCCRLAVRRCLGPTGIRTKVEALPLSKPTRDLLLYRHEFDVYDFGIHQWPEGEDDRLDP